MKKDQNASQDELITALFYLYQEALKGNSKIAPAIQVAIETCRNIGSPSPRSKNCEDILKQFYVIREFQKLDDVQKENFIQKIDDIQAKPRPKKRKSRRAV